MVIYFIIYSIFLPLKHMFVPLKYFCPITVCFLVAGLPHDFDEMAMSSSAARYWKTRTCNYEPHTHNNKFAVFLFLFTLKSRN